jgi:hypothetical protein
VAHAERRRPRSVRWPKEAKPSEACVVGIRLEGVYSYRTGQAMLEKAARPVSQTREARGVKVETVRRHGKSPCIKAARDDDGVEGTAMGQEGDH